MVLELAGKALLVVTVIKFHPQFFDFSLAVSFLPPKELVTSLRRTLWVPLFMGGKHPVPHKCFPPWL